MFDLASLAAINGRAAQLAREGRHERDALLELAPTGSAPPSNALSQSGGSTPPGLLGPGVGVLVGALTAEFGEGEFAAPW